MYVHVHCMWCAHTHRLWTWRWMSPVLLVRLFPQGKLLFHKYVIIDVHFSLCSIYIYMYIHVHVYMYMHYQHSLVYIHAHVFLACQTDCIALFSWLPIICSLIQTCLSGWLSSAVMSSVWLALAVLSSPVCLVGYHQQVQHNQLHCNVQIECMCTELNCIYVLFCSSAINR